MAMYPSQKVGGVADFTVFNDNANFTAPVSQYNHRINIVSGGYKQVGDLVYVYMTITPKDAEASFWRNGGGGGIIAGLPRAKDYHQASLFAEYWVANYGSLNLYVANNALNEGQIAMSCTPNQSMVLTHEIKIQGVYVAY